MKNVLIHKITKYIFTENQLRREWEKKHNDIPFESLTREQLMHLAKGMLESSSHHDLEHHLIGFGWRDERESQGRMIAEYDQYPDLYIEMIDTEQQGPATTVLIDRVLKVKCKGCGLTFFLEDLNTDLERLKCPACAGKVEAVSPKAVLKRESGSTDRRK